MLLNVGETANYTILVDFSENKNISAGAIICVVANVSYSVPHLASNTQFESFISSGDGCYTYSPPAAAKNNNLSASSIIAIIVGVICLFAILLLIVLILLALRRKRDAKKKKQFIVERVR